MNETYDVIIYARRTDGVILIRPKDVGVEIMTIDHLNGSFVLTDAGVQTLWNRANVWSGRYS
jgi:hypothetical protein